MTTASKLSAHAPPPFPVKGLLYAATVIWALVILFNFAEAFLGWSGEQWVYILDVDREETLYSWFSQLLLFCASAMLFRIGWDADPAKRLIRAQWFLLSFVFLFLSADEALHLHERITIPLRAALNTSGLLYWAWVIPYGLGSLIGLAAMIPFLRSLPRATAVWFAISAATFLSGAVVLEMYGAVILLQEPELSNYLYYLIEATVEEALEVLGVLIFLTTLASYHRQLRSGAFEPARRAEAGVAAALPAA
jgi:hypothetical protein